MGFLREFFYFQKSDRRVLMVALTVALVALVAVFLIGRSNSETPEPTSDSVLAMEKSSHAFAKGEGALTSEDDISGYDTAGRHVELFPFDPNTADSTQLLRLGLQPWQVRNIYRYRDRGGVYSYPEDFARLYGLTVGQYRRLAPYIRIAEEFRPASEVYGRRSHGYTGKTYGSGHPGHSEYHGYSGNTSNSVNTGGYVHDTLLYPVKLSAGEHIDLNFADTTQLRKVPGIGAYYARRIVRYRDQLGGYYDTGQLLEIEGFPQDALSYLRIGAGVIRKLNINKLREDQLRKHPYISFNQARAILSYRRLRGPIHDLNDLRLLPEFPPEMIERLAPYLEY